VVPPVPRSFVAIATALVVLLAHVACACPAMSSKVSESKPQASHRCCEQPASTHSEAPDHDEHPCPHCDGGLVAAPAKAGDAKLSPGLATFAAMPMAASAVPVENPVLASAAAVLPTPAPPTLLRLRCALNL
jgi:hypothetical protein